MGVPHVLFTNCQGQDLELLEHSTKPQKFQETIHAAFT